MHLFLKGRCGIGKSTILQKYLVPYQHHIAGFTVQRLLQNERRVGFRAVPVRGHLYPVNAEYTPEMEGAFILNGRKDVSILENIIVNAELDSCSSQYKVVILDEIGGIELMSPIFMQSLMRILHGSKPCIGVLKSAENLKHTAVQMGLKDTYMDLREELEYKISLLGKIQNVDRDFDDEIIHRWVEDYFK